jgi:Flp pilus assembly protein TadD
MKPVTLLAPILAAVVVGLMATTGAPALAADTPEPAPAAAPADPLQRARAAIAASAWPTALDELRRANRPQDADWNNLMGFALRKQAVPDLDGAQRHYDAALRINPQHQGALEYAGELDLMRGRLPEAEQKLARLAQLCRSPCEPLDDLTKAIARYKANGQTHDGAKPNRYRP